MTTENVGRAVTEANWRMASGYLVALCWALFAYSVFGKGFAYLGVPPVFPGEVLLAVGFAVAIRSGSVLAALVSPVNLILVALFVWTLSRAAPYITTFGADTIRDCAVVYYGGFALVVNALVLSDPKRIDFLMRGYAKFVRWFPLLGLIGYALTRFEIPLPVLNSSGVPIVEVRPGEAGVHAAGIAAFALLGLSRPGWARMSALAVLCIMVASANRGAMLAILASVAIASAFTLQLRQVAFAAVAGIALFASALALETATADWRPAEGSAERQVSAAQLVENFSGVVGSSGDSGEGTKEWRENWWRKITKETLYGPLFWTGRGFGVNLAQVADLPGWDPDDPPPLRSPHSVHMTMLARGGVPQLALWAAFLATWFATMANAAMLARRHEHIQWHALFIFLICYVLAILIDASFDVALEGPMVGVWFWSLIGFGSGASSVYAGLVRAPERVACA